MQLLFRTPSLSTIDAPLRTLSFHRPHVYGGRWFNTISAALSRRAPTNTWFDNAPDVADHRARDEVRIVWKHSCSCSRFSRDNVSLMRSAPWPDLPHTMTKSSQCVPYDEVGGGELARRRCLFLFSKPPPDHLTSACLAVPSRPTEAWSRPNVGESSILRKAQRPGRCFCCSASGPTIHSSLAPACGRLELRDEVNVSGDHHSNLVKRQSKSRAPLNR